MFEYFVILVWFLIVFVGSYILSTVLRKNNLGPFNTIINWLSLIGVIVHEVCHYLISLAVGIRPEAIKVNYGKKKDGRTVISGYVDLGRRRTTFIILAMFPLGSTFLFTRKTKESYCGKRKRETG